MHISEWMALLFLDFPIVTNPQPHPLSLSPFALTYDCMILYLKLIGAMLALTYLSRVESENGEASQKQKIFVIHWSLSAMMVETPED